jgi:nucleotide-binding universal stress UspA family protein
LNGNDDGKEIEWSRVEMRSTTTLFRRILVPHDFSAPSSHALDIAADLAAKHGGKITVLHVLTPFYSGPGYPTPTEIAWTPPEDIAAERREHLERLVRERLGPRARRVTCAVATGEAVPAILDAARAADVIVMATLGRTGLGHLLIGSVAEKVVRHAPVPVLTIRPPTTAQRKTVQRKKGGSRAPRR